MADQIQVLQTRITDEQNVPVSGAQVSFFRTGTETRLDVFTDSDLSVPMTNPVIADSEGRIPQVFYGEQYEVKVVVESSTGATIDTFDPAPKWGSSTSSADSISFTPIPNNAGTNVAAAIKINADKIAGFDEYAGLELVSVREYGVTPEPLGTADADLADQTAAMQAALDASASENFMLALPAGRIGTTNLRMASGTSARGVSPRLSQLVNKSPYSTLLGTVAGGTGDITLHDFRLDGGWDKKLNGAGDNWDFDAQDVAFDDIYGLNLWTPTSNSDPNNNISNLEIENIAGSGIRRFGRGGDYMSRIRIQGCARWGIYEDQQQDLHISGLDISLCGYGGWRLRGGSHTVEGANKIWFIGMAKQGTPAAALDIVDAGNGTHQIHGLTTSDVAGTAVKIQGRNSYVQLTALSTAALGRTGGDRDTAFGNLGLNQGNFAVVHFAGGSDNVVDLTGLHDKTVAQDANSDVKLCRITGFSNNNTINVSPYASRTALRTIPYDVDDPVFEEQGVRNNNGGNDIFLANGGLIHNWTYNGCSTLILTNENDTINNNTAKGNGTKRWLNDVRKTAVALGRSPNSGWVYEGTNDPVTTEVVGIFNDPEDAGVTLIEGNRYLVGPNPVAGVWVGKANQVATYVGGTRLASSSWAYAVPVSGHFLTDNSGPTPLTFDGTDWA